LSGAASVNCLPRLSLLVADDKLVRLCHPHQLMHSATSRSSSSHSRARTHARIVRPFTYAAAHLSGRRVAASVAPGYYVYNINTKNCSLSIVLTATDQKPQKIIKEVILPTITLPECQRDAE